MTLTQGLTSTLTLIVLHTLSTTCLPVSPQKLPRGVIVLQAFNKIHTAFAGKCNQICVPHLVESCVVGHLRRILLQPLVPPLFGHLPKAIHQPGVCALTLCDLSCCNDTGVLLVCLTCIMGNQTPLVCSAG